MSELSNQLNKNAINPQDNDNNTDTYEQLPLNADSQEESSTNNSKKKWFIFAGAGAAAIALVGGIFVLKGGNEESSPNTNQPVAEAPANSGEQTSNNSEVVVSFNADNLIASFNAVIESSGGGIVPGKEQFFDALTSASSDPNKSAQTLEQLGISKALLDYAEAGTIDASKLTGSHRATIGMASGINNGYAYGADYVKFLKDNGVYDKLPNIIPASSVDAELADIVVHIDGAPQKLIDEYGIEKWTSMTTEPFQNSINEMRSGKFNGQYTEQQIADYIDVYQTIVNSEDKAIAAYNATANK